MIFVLPDLSIFMELKNAKRPLGLISLVLIVAGAIISYFSFFPVLDAASTIICKPPSSDVYSNFTNHLTCLTGQLEVMFLLLPVIFGASVIVTGATVAFAVARAESAIPNTPQSDDVKIERTSYKLKSKKEETSAFCENCGNTLKPTAKFCGGCGTAR